MPYCRLIEFWASTSGLARTKWSSLRLESGMNVFDPGVNFKKSLKYRGLLCCSSFGDAVDQNWQMPLVQAEFLLWMVALYPPPVDGLSHYSWCFMGTNSSQLVQDGLSIPVRCWGPMLCTCRYALTLLCLNHIDEPWCQLPPCWGRPATNGILRYFKWVSVWRCGENMGKPPTFG